MLWRIAIAVLVIFGICVSANAASSDKVVALSIERMPLADALSRFSAAADIDVAFSVGTPVPNVVTRPLEGSYRPDQALKELLRGTGLTYEFEMPTLVILRRKPTSGPRIPALLGGDDEDVRLPEVLVRGSAPPSALGARIMEDATPYVVFTRGVLQRSPAVSVAEFLGGASSAIASNSRTRPDPFTMLPDELDLRGFGSNQTLVLIDGERLPAHSFGGLPLQPGIESIPLSAIDRIELYQANRTARYGPGAAGGVINIIQRRDCSGLAQVDYGSTFSSGPDFRRVYLAHCFSFNDQFTHLRLSGSASEEGGLSTAERSFLMDGRQAINRGSPGYFVAQGLPPLGAQTNIRSLDGSPLFGPGTSSFASIPVGYTAADGLDPLRATAGRYDLGLAEGTQMFGGGDRSLRSGPKTNFLNGSLRHRFNDSLSASIDGILSTSEVRTPVSAADTGQFSGMVVLANAPNNPFGQNILVVVPLAGADVTLKSERTAGRLRAGLRLERQDWVVRAEVTGSQADLEWRRPSMSAGVPEAVAVGALDVMRDLQRDPLQLSEYIRDGYFTSLETDATSANLRVERKTRLWGWGPAAEFSAMYERREERFRQRDQFIGDPLLGVLSSSLAAEQRTIDSVFLDARVPLMGGAEQSSFSPSLDFQASGRVDFYSTRSRSSEGTSQAPASGTAAAFSANSTLLAIRFQPVEAITFRASRGTGFLPPTASQLAQPTPFQFAEGILRDPKRGGEPTQAFSVLGGGNPALRSESTRTWSVGFSLSSAALTASLDHIRTSKQDGIISPAELFFVDPARFEDLFPNRVQREPAQPGDTYEHGRIVGVDATSVNSSQVDMSAWDGWLEYKMPETRLGAVKFSLQATLQPTFRMRNGPSGEFDNLIGASGEYPLKLAAIGGVTLTQGRWGMGWSMRYLHPYRVSSNPAIVEAQGTSMVEGQSYHDLFLQYRAGLKRDIDLAFSVKNVFGTEPPFDAAATDYFSAFGDPRLSMYALSIVAHL